MAEGKRYRLLRDGWSVTLSDGRLSLEFRLDDSFTFDTGRTAIPESI